MSEKKRNPLDGEAVNRLIGDRYLQSARQSMDEADRALEAEDPILFRKLEEHARRLREDRREPSDADDATPSAN